MDFIIGGKHAPWYVALEKGFYAKRGLAATIQAGTGSADTVRTIAAGRRRFRICRYLDGDCRAIPRHRGSGRRSAWLCRRYHCVARRVAIKGIKDLQGKSLAISPGQAQWFLMPAYCRINSIDFKSIKIQETAAPIQPAALATKKADFIIMFRASNDEVAELAASKVGVKF